GSLTKFLRNFRSQPRIFRLTHQWQHLPDSRLRDQAEKRRLLELDSQPLAQRVVEHWIASLIVEICEDDSVLVRQLGSRRGIAVRKRPGRHSAQHEEYDSSGCGEGGQPVPAEELPGSVQAARR